VSFPETVETERLRLRRLRPSDREALELIWSDADVWRALRPGRSFEPGFVRARLDHHLRHWEKHGFGVWVAELTGAREVVGWLGASHPDRLPELSKEIEIGWTLRRPFWGQGLASEGAAAAVAAAFRHLETNHVISLIGSSNRRSVAVAKRLGMRLDREVSDPELGALCVYALDRGCPDIRAGRRSAGPHKSP
jgi:RimJ/RimL family protein N-acetyltransferase